jgi:hypothetical protein
MKLRANLLIAIMSVLILATSANAKVTRIEVLSRSDVLAGRAFGDCGAYEKVIARVYFEIDPRDSHNRQIVDIDKAPRNARGKVEFSADLYLLKPKDMNRGNNAVLLEIPNRGGKALLRFFNRARSSPDPSTEAEFGDGFLMNQGFTLCWLGWQFDVPNAESAMRLYPPVATDNGKAITGLVRADFVFNSKVYDASLGHRGQNAYPVMDPENQDYVLTVRDTILGERQKVARGEWQFARVVNGKPVADPTYIYLKSGFEPGKIYELVYRAQNPVIVGTGLAAARDLISFFKYQPGALVSVRRAYGFGISQTGRFLRHFLYEGFNADERNRQVFDGIDAHVAGGGRGSFNYRFAEASRDASAFSTFLYPTDTFPFTDVEQTDPETGERDGLLTHAKNQPLPKIFYTFSSYEYWGRAASLIHTSIDGKSDAPMMNNTRIYFFAGGQHGPAAFPPTKPTSRELASPNDYLWSMRAILVALDRWVKDGTSPPPSRYPRISDGTLVRPDAVRFPKIPGVEFPKRIHEAYRVDYGPQFKTRGIASLEPPRVGRAFPMLVPQVDSDGIDLGGIRMPEVAVPLATYTGWNLRDPKMGAPDELVDFLGSYIPFARTRAEREQANDPRPSIEERYQSRDHYLALCKEAVRKLIREGYLLRQDNAAVLNRAVEYWVYATRKSTG